MDFEDRLTLEEHLCFTVYAASREITKLYRPLLDELGITYPQYLVLVVLSDKGSTTVKELGDALFLDSGTLTPLLKRMQEAGLVMRQRVQTDERKVVVELTSDGRELRHRAENVPLCLAERIGLSHRDEYETLLRQMRKLLTMVHESDQT